jgi:hypothetical protein
VNRKFVCTLLVLLPLLFPMPDTQSFAREESSPEVKLPVKCEELTSPEFAQAVELSGSVCILPIGILEKHGPHLPLGTDMMDAREVALRAAKQEYSIVFPEYYFGQIYEAKHQPGTIAYSAELVWNLLQETCDELARNGLKKIIIVNGHGGNRFFLNYFCLAQLANLIRTVKKDNALLRLQRKFFDNAENPLKTKQ